MLMSMMGHAIVWQKCKAFWYKYHYIDTDFECGLWYYKPKGWSKPWTTLDIFNSYGEIFGAIWNLWNFTAAFWKLAQSNMLIFADKGTAGDASKLFNLILCLGHSVIITNFAGIKLDAKIHGHFEASLILVHCLGWFHKKTTGGTSEGMPWLCPNGSEPAATALPFSYFLFLLRVYHVRDLLKPHLTCQNANTFNRWKSVIEEETIRYWYQTRKESKYKSLPNSFFYLMCWPFMLL